MLAESPIESNPISKVPMSKNSQPEHKYHIPLPFFCWTRNDFSVVNYETGSHSRYCLKWKKQIIWNILEEDGADLGFLIFIYRL